MFSKVGFWLGTFRSLWQSYINNSTVDIQDTGNKVFIISLAVTDLCAILSCNLIQLVALKYRMWPFDFKVCVILNIAMTHFNFSCIVHVVVIAVYRYLAAATPATPATPAVYNTARPTKVIVLVLISIHLGTFLIAVVPKLPEFHSLHFEQFLVGCTLDTSTANVAFAVLMFGTILIAAFIILIINKKNKVLT